LAKRSQRGKFPGRGVGWGTANRELHRGPREKGPPCLRCALKRGPTPLGLGGKQGNKSEKNGRAQGVFLNENKLEPFHPGAGNVTETWKPWWEKGKKGLSTGATPKTRLKILFDAERNTRREWGIASSQKQPSERFCKQNFCSLVAVGEKIDQKDGPRGNHKLKQKNACHEGHRGRRQTAHQETRSRNQPKQKKVQRAE